MTPIQLWLPTVRRSLGQKGVLADVQRAFAAWRGESFVYIVPKLGETRRWLMNPANPFARAVAVHGEGADAISVVHVGENGLLCGVPPGGQIEETDSDRLFRLWLNLMADGSFQVEPPSPVMATLELPVFRRSGRVDWARIEIERGPGAIVQARPLKGGGVNLNWSVDGLPPPVFPDVESLGRFWQAIQKSTRKTPKKRAIKGSAPSSVSFRITGALAPLFPMVPGLDDLSNWTKMRGMADMSRTDPEEALAMAKTFATPYLSAGESTRAFTWFWPLMLQIGPQAAIALGVRFGLPDCRTLGEIANSAAWRERLEERVPVRRAWGAVVLFWALLIDRLEERRPVSICKNCNRALSTGRKLKEYCSRADNEACFNQRATKYQRKSRQKRRA